MAMTLQERRKRDRVKKAAQRAAARVAGVPAHHAVLKAIAEASAFALAGVNIAVQPGEAPVSLVDMKVVIRTASTILVKRGHFDAEQSRKAILKVLAPRPEHRWVSHVPTLAKPLQRVAQPVDTTLSV